MKLKIILTAALLSVNSLITNTFAQTNTAVSANTKNAVETEKSIAAAQTKTVVFITGAFVSSSSWDAWKVYFEQKGYTVLVPAWPYKDAPAAELRERQPNDTALANLRLKDLKAYYAGIVSQLPEKPILIGHSYGGLLVQLLLQQDLGAAGIAIHSLPPRGVITLKPSFIKSVWKPLGLFSSKKETYMMSFEHWQYTFTNGMTLAQQQASYAAITIPESKRIALDALTKEGQVNFKKAHAPLLFISGSTDHILPASLNYSNYKKYRKSPSITDYKEFEGRNHYVLGLDSWHDEADYILNWISQH